MSDDMYTLKPFSPRDRAPVKFTCAVALASGGPEASFQVVEGIPINLTEGPPDSGLTVSGSGFTANDPQISIIYDRDHVLVQAASDAQGSFTEIIQIWGESRGKFSTRPEIII